MVLRLRVQTFDYLSLGVAFPPRPAVHISGGVNAVGEAS